MNNSHYSISSTNFHHHRRTMALNLTIPAEYGYVLLAAAGSTAVPLYHVLQVVKYRRLTDIRPPTLYASPSEAAASKEKYLYNCAQRAHANFTENHPSFLTVLLIAGLQYPVTSAWLGAIWTLGRFVYAWGYVRDLPDGKGRQVGSWWEFPQLGLMGLAFTVGFRLAREAWLA